MLEKIKKLRNLTGAGMVDVKKALSEADGDMDKAAIILRKKGQEKAKGKSDRTTQEGIVLAYIHSNNRVGAMVKLLCESDFVARTDEFKTLAMDIAMHITAMNPKFLKPEDVTSDLVKQEKEIWKEQLKNEKKPSGLIDKIMAGKEKKFRQDLSLLTQPFVKDQDMTVEELIAQKIAKIGENIQVGEFKRIEL
jgi:elongation factor Ts